MLRELSPLLQLAARTVTGRTLGEEIAGAVNHDRDVIRSLDAPLKGPGGLAVSAARSRPTARW